MSDKKLVRGHWFVTGGAETDTVLTDAAVRVESGTIAEVGDWQRLRAAHPRSFMLLQGPPSSYSGARNRGSSGGCRLRME